MTIKNRKLWEQRTHVKDCVTYAPTGTYEFAREIDNAVDAGIEAVRDTLKFNGLDSLGDDRCADLEAHIYGFLKESNPERWSEFVRAEAFGKHCEDPATRDRIVENARRSKESLDEALAR